MQGTDAANPDPLPEIRGLKYFKTLLPLFERLHDVGCARDTAGNRDLHFDQYAALVMLYLFNPLIGSLRTLQQSLGLPKVAQTLGVKRFSAGSFSEAPAVFEPQRLLRQFPLLQSLNGAVLADAANVAAADIYDLVK